MSTTFYIELEGGGHIKQEGAPINGKILLEAYEPIVNTGATEDSGNRYNVCQRSGFKQMPDSLSTQWDGAKVRLESYDVRSQQDFVKVHAEELRGAKRPEPANVFVTTSTAPEDL